MQIFVKVRLSRLHETAREDATLLLLSVLQRGKQKTVDA